MLAHYRALRKILKTFEGSEILDYEIWRQEREIARWNDRPKNKCSIQEWGDLVKVPGGWVVKRRPYQSGASGEAAAGSGPKGLVRKGRSEREDQDGLF